MASAAHRPRVHHAQAPTTSASAMVASMRVPAGPNRANLTAAMSVSGTTSQARACHLTVVLKRPMT